MTSAHRRSCIRTECCSQERLTLRGISLSRTSHLAPLSWKEARKYNLSMCPGSGGEKGGLQYLGTVLRTTTGHMCVSSSEDPHVLAFWQGREDSSLRTIDPPTASPCEPPPNCLKSLKAYSMAHCFWVSTPHRQSLGVSIPDEMSEARVPFFF